MIISIREKYAQFADKTNFIPGINYIFIEQVKGRYVAYTFQYNRATHKPMNEIKLFVASADSYSGILDEIHEFEMNYGKAKKILNQNEDREFYFVQKAKISYKLKIAQKIKEHTENLNSPKVTLESGASNLVNEAVNILNSKDPEILKGITDIIVHLDKNVYGEFNSANLHTVYINLQKIENEIKNRLAGKSEEEIKKEIIRQLAIVISHESFHQKAYVEKGDISEFPAEEGERKVEKLI